MRQHQIKITSELPSWPCREQNSLLFGASTGTWLTGSTANCEISDNCQHCNSTRHHHGHCTSLLMIWEGAESCGGGVLWQWVLREWCYVSHPPGLQYSPLSLGPTAHCSVGTLHNAPVPLPFSCLAVGIWAPDSKEETFQLALWELEGWQDQESLLSPALWTKTRWDLWGHREPSRKGIHQGWGMSSPGRSFFPTLCSKQGRGRLLFLVPQQARRGGKLWGNQ